MRVLIGIALALSIVSCGGSDASPTTPPVSNKTYEVVTIATAFSPAGLSIAKGDTVKWTFAKAPDGLGHDVHFASAPGQPQDIAIQTTGSVSRVFTTRGNFDYDCRVHPGMTGSISVQ